MGLVVTECGLGEFSRADPATGTGVSEADSTDRAVGEGSSAQARGAELRLCRSPTAEGEARCEEGASRTQLEEVGKSNNLLLTFIFFRRQRSIHYTRYLSLTWKIFMIKSSYFFFSLRSDEWVLKGISGYIYGLWMKKTFGVNEYRHWIKEVN